MSPLQLPSVTKSLFTASTRKLLFYNFSNLLEKHDYVLVKNERVQGMVINVFCLKKHKKHLSSVETETARTGIAGVWVRNG